MSHCATFRRPSAMAEGRRGAWFAWSVSIIIGDGFLRGGDTGRCGMGSKDSIPGSRIDCFWSGPLLSTAGNGAGARLNWEGVMTWLKRLPPFGKLLLSGCHVRLRHASSATLVTESRRDHPEVVDVVGDASRLPLGDDRAAPLDEFMDPCVKRGRPRFPDP